MKPCIKTLTAVLNFNAFFTKDTVLTLVKAKPDPILLEVAILCNTDSVWLFNDETKVKITWQER